MTPHNEIKNRSVLYIEKRLEERRQFSYNSAAGFKPEDPALPQKSEIIVGSGQYRER